MIVQFWKNIVFFMGCKVFVFDGKNFYVIVSMEK